MRPQTSFAPVRNCAQTYRDAVEFRNGMRVRLQELEDGQQVEVLALSSEKAELQGRPITVHA